MSIIIRKATANDVKELDKIQKMAFSRLYDIYNDKESPYLDSTDRMLKWISKDDFSYWKIYYMGTLCGGIVYYNRCENEYYLARIYVEPSFQCKGIAKKAILLCEKEFTNAEKYTLDFPIDQIANKTCYEGVGYVDTGKRKQINGKLTLAIYEKIV